MVRVKKDGTGSVISRYYFSPQMLAMVDQVAGVQLPDGGPGGNLGLIAEIAKPDQASLEADAANYGEGVRYKKHEPGKDDEGWSGYVVVYEFDDITKVQIDQNSVPGKAKEFIESSGEEIKADQGGRLTFDKDGDTLTIHSSFATAGLDDMMDEEKLAQAEQLGKKPSEMMQMAAGMTDGMRVGFFVKADGGIAETNAEHVTGDLIILSDADVSKVMLDPDFGAFVDKAAENPEAVTEESVKKLFADLEAMTVDTSSEITLKFE